MTDTQKLVICIALVFIALVIRFLPWFLITWSKPEDPEEVDEHAHHDDEEEDLWVESLGDDEDIGWNVLREAEPLKEEKP